MTGSKLFKPLALGNGHIKLQHRIGLCPLTRFRASDEHVPLDFVVDYYAQRASEPGTILISEGTFISAEDGGTDNVPGIYNEDQIQAWRKVTDAVHAKGSYIFCQLWSIGRTASPDVAKREGITVSGADEIPLNETSPRPHRLTVTEIHQRCRNFATAATNAITAGFDGVELHGANGYLIDQFTQDNSNHRTDDYGGSVENRSRFAVEATQAVCEAVGADKVGIRLSPWSTFQAMKMDDPVPQFSDLITKLSGLKLAYLHLVESRIAGSGDVESSENLDFAIERWNGPLLIAGGFKPDTARKLVDEEYPTKDIVVMFGRYFISTPDLPYRLREGLELNPYDRSTFYTPKSPVGYVDYPAIDGSVGRVAA
ncbi:hypothetical protein ACHAO9_008947 [Fusarium lateritium]